MAENFHYDNERGLYIVQVRLAMSGTDRLKNPEVLEAYVETAAHLARQHLTALRDQEADHASRV